MSFIICKCTGIFSLSLLISNPLYITIFQIAIEKALEDVCNFLPSSLKQECDSLVEQFGPVIITLLVNELKPDAVCGVLGLCSNQTGLLLHINEDFLEFEN